jgi:hypothetical protein
MHLVGQISNPSEPLEAVLGRFPGASATHVSATQPALASSASHQAATGRAFAEDRQRSTNDAPASPPGLRVIDRSLPGVGR